MLMDSKRQSSQKPNSASSRQAGASGKEHSHAAVPLHPFEQVQQTLGNQAMLRRMQSGLDPDPIHGLHQLQPMMGNHGVAHRLQAKLTVNIPGDQHEQEADRVAEQVVRMPEPRRAASAVSSARPNVQRKCACGGTCSKCQGEEHDDEHKLLQMKSAGPNAAPGIPAPPVVHQALRSPGRPLDSATRAFMEPRFGYDFSDVRVHTSSQAMDSAKAIQARAYTVGRNIVFGTGQFAPATQTGQQLLAHELTHVVQQERTSVAAVQRSPAPLWECTTCHKPMTGSFTPMVSVGAGAEIDDRDALYFGTRPTICSNCHQKEEQRNFPTHVQPGGKRVDYQNIIEWAVEQVFDLATKDDGKKAVFSLLQKHEDKGLVAIWERHVPAVIATVASDQSDREHIFTGSTSARSRFAAYLDASHDQLIQMLNDKAVDLLVQEIKAAIRSYHCRGSSLITDPKGIKQIEDNPDLEGVALPIAGTRQIWKPKLEMGPVRIRSAGGGTLVYEIIGHEGIYFETSTTAMTIYGCTVALNMRQSVQGGVFFDQIWQAVSKFTKGLMTAAASPVEAIIEAAAQVIDLASQAIAAFGKWTGWYHMGYTCLSSACKKAEACLEEGKSVGECQAIGLRDAAKSASIVIPLYEQGQACLSGDFEACGSIAPMFIGLVPKGPRLRTLAEIERAEASAAKGGKLPAELEREQALASARGGKALTGAELEDVAIREAIGRRRAGDPRIAEAFEKPKAPAKPSAPRRKPAGQKDVAMETAVHESAQKAGSELKLDDETHGVAAYGKGKEAEILFCSEPYCSIVREKVGTILEELPKNYDVAMKSDLRHLYLRIEGIERNLKAGQLTEEMANRFSHEITAELDSYAQRDRNIRQLLKRTTEDLRANRARITKELEGRQLTEPPAKPRPQPGVRGTAGTRAGRTYRIYPERKVANSQRGYQVYEYRNAKGELLYVGKSGGASGKKPMNWSDRLKEEHIETEWIGEARSVTVISELGEQEAFALEEDLIDQKPRPKYNKKPGEYSSRFPQGDRAANAKAASKHGATDRFTIEVMF